MALVAAACGGGGPKGARTSAAGAHPQPSATTTPPTPASPGADPTASTAPGSAPGSSTTGPAAAATTGPTVGAPPTTHAPTPTTGGGSRSLKGSTIVIDPGHNGANFSHASTINQLVFVGNGSKACDTTGTETNDGYTEAAFNFDVATRLAALLRAAGATVVLTRSDNNGVGPCVNQRAAIGNQAHGDAAISIHADGGPAGGRGFHVIQPAPIAGYNTAIVAPSDRLALDVRRDYPAATGMPVSTYAGSNGLETRSDLGGLNLSTIPKVFIETGNMRNTIDASLLESADFRQKTAQGLAQAFTDFLAGR